MRKGQVTIFVIIGLVLVAVALLLMQGRSILVETIEKESTMESIKVPAEVSDVNEDLKACVKKLCSEAVFTLGQQGGHAELLNNGFVVNGSIVGYNFNEGKVLLPGKEVVEETMSDYVSHYVDLCVSPEQYKGYRLEFGKPITNVLIEENEINVAVNYDLKIVREGREFFLSDKNFISIPLRFGALYTASKEILDDHAYHPGSLCLSCVLGIVEEYGLDSELQTYGEGKVVLVLTDKNSLIDDAPLQFIFAMKFP